MSASYPRREVSLPQWPPWAVSGFCVLSSFGRSQVGTGRIFMTKRVPAVGSRILEGCTSCLVRGLCVAITGLLFSEKSKEREFSEWSM